MSHKIELNHTSSKKVIHVSSEKSDKIFNKIMHDIGMYELKDFFFLEHLNK